MSSPRFSWTQPICAGCYAARFPGREPARMMPDKREREVCVDCGQQTGSGIYFRIDPAEARHPTLLKDD